MVQTCQIPETHQGIGVLFPERLAPQFNHPFQLPLRLRIYAEFNVSHADGAPDGSLYKRLLVKLAFDTRCRPVQGRPDLEVRIGSCAGARLCSRSSLGQQVILEEVADCFGGGGLIVSPSFFHQCPIPCS